MRSWSGLLVHVTMVAGLVTGAAAARAADQDPAIAQGHKLYDEYCASCHGADGKGTDNKAKGSDLTQIAKKNGGKFPFYDVMLQISGRKPTGQDEDTSLPGSSTKPHGDGKMPSWRQIFGRQEGATALDLQLQTTGKIMLITEYLQSIQQK